MCSQWSPFQCEAGSRAPTKVGLCSMKSLMGVNFVYKVSSMRLLGSSLSNRPGLSDFLRSFAAS